MTREQDEGLRELSERILADARAQAASAVEDAEKAAGALEDHARREAEKAGLRLRAQAESEAAATQRQILSAARVEAKLIVLARREALISRAMEMAGRRLREPLPAGEREGVLRRLAVEGAKALGGGEIEVRVSLADQATLSESLLRSIEDELRKTGIAARLTRGGEPVPISGGVILVKDDGRVIYDNSFDGRLQRMGDVLRGVIWEALSGQRVARPAPGQMRPAA